MSVIVFAPPQPELAMQQAEVSAVVNAFYRPLLAYTEAELRQVASKEMVDGFWFCGHSAAGGIVAAGQMLTPAVIGQYLSTAGVEWSFLNSCESAAFIEQIQAIYAHDCYANITEVNDTSAWRTAALVAAKYANVGDIHVAVALAVPPGATPLRFFPNPSSNRGDMTSRGVPSNRDDINISRLFDDIAELTAAIQRLTESNQKLTEANWSLRSEVALLKQKTETENALMVRRIDQVERNSSGPVVGITSQQAAMIVGVLVLIAALLAYGLYLVASGG